MVREFDCAVCGGHFLTTTLEADINREFQNSGIDRSGDESERHSVCDVCYDAVMRRARELGVIPTTEGDQ